MKNVIELTDAQNQYLHETLHNAVVASRGLPDLVNRTIEAVVRFSDAAVAVGLLASRVRADLGEYTTGQPASQIRTFVQSVERGSKALVVVAAELEKANEPVVITGKAEKTG